MPFPGEIEWYLKYASKQDPILELACGSGRITLPLAEAGFKIHAVDRSQTMLNRLQEKLTKYPLRTGRRIVTICDDMATFSPAKSYSLIILPYNSLQYLETKEHVRTFFMHVFSELISNGYFLFVVKRWNSAEFTQGERIIDWMDKPLTMPETKVTVGSKLKFTLDDERRQIINTREYRIAYPDGKTQNIRQVSCSPIIETKEYIEMLDKARFNTQSFSDYDEILDDGKSREMCCVCRKK